MVKILLKIETNNSISLSIKNQIMKKNYFRLLLFFILGLFFNFNGFGQVVANDDTIDNINSVSGGFFYNTFLGNDTLNGNAVSTAVVTVTQVSTTNPDVYVTTGGILYVAAGTPAGTYTIQYQICQSTNPGNCDTATITVNVCNQAAPTVASQECSMPADVITLNNLPETGTWSLTMTSQWPQFSQTFTGNGTSFTITDVVPSYYAFQVTNSSGCVSPITNASVGGYINGIETTLIGTYQDLNNDGIVNIGDIINYQITITNTSTCEMTDVEVDYEELGGNATVFGSPIASISAGMSAVVTAYYSITQADINNGGEIYNWFAVRGDLNSYEVYSKAFDQTGIPLNIPDGIKLNAFIDTNGNGIQENNEEDFTLGYFQYTINDNPTGHILYYTNDPIIYETNPFTTYDVTLILYSEYASYYNLVTATHNDISIAGNPGITTYNFPVTVIPYQDVAIHMYNATTATPGFPYINYITYSNNGNQTIPSGTITLVSDTTFPITTPETITPTPEGFTFNFTNLLPFETRTMVFSMQVPTIPTIALGDIVTNTVSITPTEGDMLPLNNSSVVTVAIVGSYDPNDKAENHGDKILHSTFTENDYLTYTIRFENTGTANAFTVQVTDVLDEQLDETSIRMVGASHNYILERTGSGLTWTFNNIQLPPSVPNTQTGHGHVAFQVKPKPGYAVGDIIPNTASIFFDFNPAIVTNTTNTEFVATLNTDDFNTNDFKAFPNPVKNLLNVVSNNSTVETVTVHDILGKTILSKTVNGTNTMLDVSGLSTGMYLVKVVSAQGEKVFKIIKE